MPVNQTNNSKARETILSTIRQNLAASAAFDLVHQEHSVHQQKTTVLIEESSFLENAPLAESLMSDGCSLTENFRNALISIGGNCQIVRNETEAAQIVQEIINRKKPVKIAVTDSVLAQSVGQQLKTTAAKLENAGAAELFDCDLGITGAQWAIAETGTLVLESDSEFNRLTSLVPLVHIAIIDETCLRQTLGEILETLNQNGAEKLSRTITFITGPSRTSDIELTLAIGVHGPGELYVIVVSNENYDEKSFAQRT